jgi:hypothetical protein
MWNTTRCAHSEGIFTTGALMDVAEYKEVRALGTQQSVNLPGFLRRRFRFQPVIVSSHIRDPSSEQDKICFWRSTHHLSCVCLTYMTLQPSSSPAWAAKSLFEALFTQMHVFFKAEYEAPVLVLCRLFRTCRRSAANMGRCFV